MAKRGLLIGSQTFGLAGCDADVELVRALLEEREFDLIETRTGPDASRGGIVEAFDSLVAATGPNDAVVVYYSGHGSRLPHPEWEARQTAGLPPFLQYLVLWDIEASTEGDFRGLLAEELSELQWRLTEKTRNVTTILDCCHSGYMARRIDLVPKAISRSLPLAGALARLASVPSARPFEAAATNPNVVRIVACQPEQSAYERPSDLDGGRHGVLTESLAVVLRNIGERQVSWATVGDLVRRHVLSLVPHQRPEIEGPAERVPFTLDTRIRRDALPVHVEGEKAVIEAASVIGVSVGDTFQLVAPSGDLVLGSAETVKLDKGRAVLKVNLTAGAVLPSTCEAVPVALALPPRAVRVMADAPRQQAIETLVSASPRLRPATDEEPVLATIRANGEIAVEDCAGSLVRSDRFTDDDTGRRRAVEVVEILGAAERMRALASGPGAAALDACVRLELATYVLGARTVRKLNGETLFAGDRISLTIQNSSDHDLFVWLFDVGVSGRITLVTNDSPSGARLSPQGTPGSSRSVGGPSGTALAWPVDVPMDAPRPEMLVVIVADRQQNLRPLETPAGASRRAAVGVASSLDGILEELRSGIREFPSAQEANPLRYRVDRVEFFLDPRPRPRLDEPEFEIDDRSDVSVRMLRPRASQPPPSRIAVRLIELMVRRNRALFRAAVRLDALVVSGGANDRPGIAHATTFRFPNIGDREMLPMDDVLLFNGDVQDFLELAIWVSRDDEKGRDLAELLSGEIGSDEVKGALAALGGLALSAPHATVAVGAVAGVATLVRVGARLVRMATGREIGVYRTSKLAFEQFGVGRTPSQGRRQAQDVEFAYEVVEIP